jgi:murein L,D-transpeptidase YcbB/YkuD
VRGAQRPQIIALAVAIRQGTAPPPAQNWTDAMIANLPTLVQGSADKAGAVQYVRRMQALVKVIGDVNKLPAASAVAVTGSFDRATWMGLLAIQKLFGLTQDGVCGPKTWLALVAGQHG